MHRDAAGGTLALSLVAISLVSGQASGTSDEALKRKIDAVFSDVRGVGEPGYAVGVVRGGEFWYGRGFGASNLDYGLPITTRSAFNVASLSKQFTAACLAILVRRGRVGLDDSVRKYLPEMPARFGAVRIAHLVYMTSGLPEYFRLARPGGRDWSQDYFTIEAAIAAVFSLEFSPGSRWSYSLREHSLGGPALAALLLSTRRFGHPKANDAFGIVWGEFDGHRTLWYQGGDAGFSAYSVRLPDDDLSVIVLSNLGDGNAADRARRVLRLLVGRRWHGSRRGHPSRHCGRKSGSMRSMSAPRVKISVSLPRDLVARIDSAARSEARSRSRVLEGWLRASTRERAARELEAATTAYYESLTPEDRHEDEAMASASSRAARHLGIDDSPRSGSRRKRRG